MAGTRLNFVTLFNSVCNREGGRSFNSYSADTTVMYYFRGTQKRKLEINKAKITCRQCKTSSKHIKLY